jgi:PAS domain S-box-containing protein
MTPPNHLPSSDTDAATPDPVAPNIDAVATQHARAGNHVDPQQRRLEAVTAWLCRPQFFFGVLAAVAVWVSVNSVLTLTGLPRMDEPPYFWLQGIIGLCALLMTTVVLITQNRQGKVAERREHSDLQMSLLTEQRTAKIIQLIEELRRDLPSVDDRLPPEAEAIQRAEQMAEDARAYAQSVADTVREPLLVLDRRNLRILSANPAYQETFGIDAAAPLEGTPLFQVNGGMWNIPVLHALLEDVTPHDAVLRGLEIDHTFTGLGRRILVLNARRLHLSGGGSDLILLGMEDVTERREGEERLRLLGEGAKDYAMLMTDPEGRIVFWSEGAERILGYTSDEAVGQPVALLFTPEDREARVHEDELFRAATRGKAEYTRWHLCKDGTCFWADGTVRPLYDQAGDLRGYGKVIHDATAQRRMMDDLEARAAERNEEAATPV